MSESKTNFRVLINKPVQKNLDKMPKREKELFDLLAEDLRSLGPIRKNWPNFSSLEKNKYHCHLSRKWVACWQWEKDTIVIEVYYAGSREKAPY
jgi:mRNA-degrading endonuclease RelE of RelBE toxin-antitoxin system